jgi:hypothetical protein
MKYTSTGAAEAPLEKQGPVCSRCGAWAKWYVDGRYLCDDCYRKEVLAGTEEPGGRAGMNEMRAAVQELEHAVREVLYKTPWPVGTLRYKWNLEGALKRVRQALGQGHDGN